MYRENRDIKVFAKEKSVYMYVVVEYMSIDEVTLCKRLCKPLEELERELILNCILKTKKEKNCTNTS